MASYFVALFVSIIRAAETVGWAAPAFLICALAERFAPVYGARPRLSTQIRGVLFQLLGTMLGTACVFLLLRWMHAEPHYLLAALWFPLAILLADFFMYWEHRFEHRFLWRFHSVHHSVRDISGTTNINHFAHAVFMQVVYSGPLSLLTHDPFGVPAMAVALYVQSTYVHSPLKLSIGPLRWVFNDNRIHRVHHAIDERLHGRNFGAVFTFWDVLFGTMYWPEKDEWPDAGIAEHGEIETVRDFLLIPFRRRAS